MSDQSQTTANTPAENVHCKAGCGFFVSFISCEGILERDTTVELDCSATCQGSKQSLFSDAVLELARIHPWNHSKRRYG
jgi:protein tyrosine phosphatase